MSAETPIPVENLKNLGPKSAEMLQASGIATCQQLCAVGAIDAFLMVRQCGFAPTLNLLWALAAGIENRDWRELSEKEKRQLRNNLQSRSEASHPSGPGSF